jgi:hypothetical protein
MQNFQKHKTWSTIEVFIVHHIDPRSLVKMIALKNIVSICSRLFKILTKVSKTHLNAHRHLQVLDVQTKLQFT